MQARIVLFRDRLSAGGAGSLQTIVQNDRRLWQIIEKRLSCFQKEAEPVLHSLVFSTGADRLI